MDEGAVFTIPSLWTDDSEDTTSRLRGMHSTISKDHSDEVDDSTSGVPAQLDEHDATAAGQEWIEEQQTIDAPSDDETEELYPALTSTNTLFDATKLGVEIRRRLEGLPGIGPSDNDPNQQVVEYLIKSVARLSVENEMLKTAALDAQKRTAESRSASTPNDNIQNSDDSNTPIFKEYHGVRCAGPKTNIFQDAPRVFKGDRKSDHLRGRRGIADLTAHFDKSSQLAYAIVHQYSCSCYGGPDYHHVVGSHDGKLLDDSAPAETKYKCLVLNKSLRETLSRIAQQHQSRFQGLVGNPRMFCYEPFLPFYLHNKTFLELAASSNLSDFDLKATISLCTWFEDNFRKVWDETDELLSRGKITYEHYKRLFRPGELVVAVTKDKFGTLNAGRVKPHSWEENSGEVYCEYWTFNGVFQKVEVSWHLNAMFKSDGEEVAKYDGEVDITDLQTYPLRFADPSARDRLIARGNRFWRCRKKTLVSYSDPEHESDDCVTPADRRFMIDYHMLRRMHPTKVMFQSDIDDLGTAAMKRDEPPSDEFLAVLPSDIHAFDFSRKAWKLIRVDRITDVTWNKDAFKRLVAPDVTKELIQAAVMAHGHRLSPAPDIIADKGQGLLILLHGSPGTGKTLTAESIAETQERPLYRITCGDIGVEPAEAELYLESVLDIGKAWGCVVLLDEADVFLEERNVTDQKQNALVSVFLRALEYYDGILILTTNRVGTFDEAFKSRIHLTIQYPHLDEDQRVEIWQNFINMLAKAKERIDTNDLELNVHKLAQIELNGREIRNVITLARYLARFRKQMLVYKHVQDALSSVAKFNDYLLQLRGSDDRWASESRLR